MTDKQSSYECTIICWAIAAVVGLAAMGMLYFLADFSGLQAVFTGGLVGFLLGVALSLFVCRGQTAAADLTADEKPAQRYSREAAEDKAARQASMPSAGAPAAAASASTTPSSLISSPAPQAADPAPAAKTDNAHTEAPVAEAAKPAPAKPAPAKPEPAKAKAEDKPKPAAPAADTKAASGGDAPRLYDAPPAEGADDLKLISGVGPKLEQTLNEIGVYRFEQVAEWGASDIAYVDDRLRFKGRIERDDWMSQAKILAAGGETEFSKKKK